MILRVLPIVLAHLAGAAWVDAETVNVESVGAVNLAPFACQDITRSSVVNRVCYDAASRRMIVHANAAWSQYCGVPEAVRDSFLNAPSMGQYYNANIKASETAGPYECGAPVIGGRSVYQNAIPPQYRKRAGERPARLP